MMTQPHIAMSGPRSRHAESARTPRVVRCEIDLIELPHVGSFFHPFRKPPVRLELPMLSARENATWQDRLDQLEHECGCRAAVAALAAFVIAGIAWVLFAALQPDRGEAPDYSAIGMYSAAFVAGLILCTLLGKLAGLALAHLRYRRTCRALLQALQKPGSAKTGVRVQFPAMYAVGLDADLRHIETASGQTPAVPARVACRSL